MEIIRNCRSKDKAVIDGINRYDEKTGHTPLTMLVSSKHCTISYLKLLASFDGFDSSLRSKNEQYKQMSALEIADQRKKAVFKTILTHM